MLLATPKGHAGANNLSYLTGISSPTITTTQLTHQPCLQFLGTRQGDLHDSRCLWVKHLGIVGEEGARDAR